MRRLAALVLALAAWPAFAQDGSELAPESAPAPAARPEETQSEASAEPPDPSTEEPSEPASPEGEAADTSGDAPALIPPEEVPSDAEASGDPPGDPPALVEPGSTDEPGEPGPGEELGEPPMRAALTETPDELAACLAELDKLGVVYERTDPIAEADSPECGIVSPVTVTEIVPGVMLEPASPMRCATALAAARWTSDVVVPLSRKLDRGDVTAIDQGAPYVCRPRADGQMSEHAWGNAIDVMGFRFSEGEPIPVQPRAGDGTREEAFQRAVRAGACLDFETVLGPGSDEDHADHLHFDIRARNGGFRICE